MARGKPRDGSKNPGGAPKIYDADTIANDLIAYINGTDDPYTEEFTLSQPFSHDTFYRLAKENIKLSEAIKLCHNKQAMRTVRKAESGDINCTFAIFKLKQKCYGWSDRQEIDMAVTEMPKIILKPTE